MKVARFVLKIVGWSLALAAAICCVVAYWDKITSAVCCLKDKVSERGIGRYDKETATDAYPDSGQLCTADCAVCSAGQYLAPLWDSICSG